MIKVYHAKDLTEQKFPDDYELVALVETDNLDHAFELTNTFDMPWWEKDGVRCLKETRSTSVGDVLEFKGKLFRCENAGWSEINE